MDESPRGNRIGLILAVAALLGVLVAVAALLDVGPFADDELSVEEFIAQGDEICSQAHDEFLDLQDGVVPRTPGDAAELTGALIEVAEEERDAIADLREPETLSAQVERYLEARDRGIEILQGTAGPRPRTCRPERATSSSRRSSRRPRSTRASRSPARSGSRSARSRSSTGTSSSARPRSPLATDPSAPPTVNNPPTGTP